MNVLAPFRLDDLGLLNVIRVQRKVLLGRLNRRSFLFFRLRWFLRRLGGWLRGGAHNRRGGDDVFFRCFCWRFRNWRQHLRGGLRHIFRSLHFGSSCLFVTAGRFGGFFFFV